MNNNEWLVFSFSLPAKQPGARVKIWRRLQAMGAVLVKNSFYVLPFSEERLEQLGWLAKETEDLGGVAAYLSAASIGNMEKAEVEAAFARARDADCAALVEEMESVLSGLAGPAVADADQTARERDAAAARVKFARRIETLAGIDFFPSGKLGRARALLAELAELAGGGGEASATAVPRREPAAYLGKLWITRPRPYVDRLASFWLVRRFIDPGARVAFTTQEEASQPKPGQVRFDMAEAEFTHVGGLTTFEVMVEAFGLAVPERFRATIRAIDLGEFEPAPAEAAGVKRLLDGLLQIHSDDQKLMDQGLALFDALHASYDEPQGE
jgi:hypothetical protein